MSVSALQPRLMAGRPPRLGWADLRDASARILPDERSRWPLWVPVGVGSGVALYFALPNEPWRWAGAVLMTLFVLLGFAWRRRTVACAVACGLAALFCGLAVAQWHAVEAAAPVLERTLRNVTVTGVIEAIAPTARGGRLTIRVQEITRLSAAGTPRKVRVTATRLPPGLKPGTPVQLRATLSPPPEPAMPGAYDFQRRAWFEQLGGVGFATGRISPLAAAADTTSASVLTRWVGQPVASLRSIVEARIALALDGTARGLALALIIGERGVVPEPVTQALRDSGLAHLLAISGLHLGLVAGFVFLLVRGGLALAPSVALRQPIKKWAAGVAVVAAFGYLLLAGAPVPTQRAFVMTGLLLLAVMIDRVGISMRLVGWAALVVLFLQPESLPGASFQMSFAAVVALVAVYEGLGARLRPLAGGAGSLHRVGLYIAGVALTSLVAGLATAPFALFHFDRFALFGLVANMLAVPIAALWVMPCAVAALLLMPLGLEALALVPMGWGLDIIVAIAELVAGWPGAVLRVAGLPVFGLGLIVLGGLWLAIWQRGWRFAGLPFVLGGIATAGLAVPPDLLVTGDGRLMGYRDGDTLYVSSAQTDPFARDIWMHRSGTADWVTFDDGVDAMACDGIGCLLRRDGRIIAFVTDERSLEEDCRAADIVIAAVSVQRNCAQPSVVIDRFDLWRDGAHAVWLGTEAGGPIEVRSVNDSRGRRPWVPVRGRNAGQ
jgi:competence protein ComEC